MARIRRWGKPFSFLPAILMMLLIFSFSSDSGGKSQGISYQITEQVVNAVDCVPFVSFTDEARGEWVERLHFYVRKLAHISEYALLSILWIFPLTRYRLTRRAKYAAAVAVCFLYAVTDETHQLFVRGRSGQLSDVLVDAVGALLGVVIWHAAARIVTGWRAKRSGLE